MNLKEYYKQKLLYKLNEDDAEYDEENAQAVATLTGRLQKAQSQSAASGLDPLNDSIPYAGGPQDTLRAKTVSSAATTYRNQQTPTQKLADPLGLKPLGRAMGFAKDVNDGSRPSPPRTQNDIQGQYADAIKTRYDRADKARFDK
jgi:hypothetical protein